MRKLAIFFITISIINCYAQDGILDPTFGVGGKVVTNVKNYYMQIVYNIAIQKDNKFIVTGEFHHNDWRISDFVTLRYNSDGSLDSTFSNDGIAIDSFSVRDQGHLIAIQEDGKIVVAGSTHNGTDYDSAVLRYCSDGILDSTFNDSGIVITPIGNGSNSGSSMSIQEDGKIVVAGSMHNGNDYDITIIRYFSDGSLDHTFDNDGIVITPISSANDRVISMSIQEDGKIFVEGTTTNDSDFAVFAARYNADGKLDNTFNNNGIITTSIDSGSVVHRRSVLIHNDGGIVVFGTTGYNSEDYYVIEKYNKNGFLDSTFNKIGKIIVSNCVTCGIHSGDGAIAIQKDGRIIFGGTGTNGTNFDFMLIRYNTNGMIDSSFGDNGIILTDFDDEFNFLCALNVQDGKIVAGGFSAAGDQSHFYAAIARYNVVITNIKNNSKQAIPFDYSLHQNYPNPFNPITTINYSLPKAEIITLELYNIQGKKVRTLCSGFQNAGNYSLKFNASNLSSGIYIYRLKTKDFSCQKRMVLLK